MMGRWEGSRRPIHTARAGLTRDHWQGDIQPSNLSSTPRFSMFRACNQVFQK